MDGGKYRGHTFRLDHFAAALRNFESFSEKSLGCSGSETNDDLRLNSYYFRIEPRTTGCDFECAGLFMDAFFAARFPLEVLYCVGDIDQLPVDACGFQGPIQ